MGFFSFYATKKKGRSKPKYSAALLEQHGCLVCPLRLKEPKLEPAGSDRPLLYFLGEAPIAEGVRYGDHFAGKAGVVLRKHTKEWRKYIRYNLAVRSHPTNDKGDRKPTPNEIACCKPSVVQDIARTKPRAIFGFGAAPLASILDRTHIAAWHGKRVPVIVGGHPCWYYAFHSPEDVANSFKLRAFRGKDGYKSEFEHSFGSALKRAFAEIEDLPDPIVDSFNDAMAGIEPLTDARAIVKAIEQAADAKTRAIDYETPCLRPYEKGARILSVAVSTNKRHVAFAMRHREAGFTRRELGLVEDAWYYMLTQASGATVAHNVAFEMEWSAWAFGDEAVWEPWWACTQAQAFIIDERQVKMQEGPQSLGFLVKQHYGFDLKDVSHLDRKRMADVPLKDMLPYNALDSKYCLSLYHDQRDVIRREGLGDVFAHHMRRISAVTAISLKGVPLSQPAVEGLHSRYEGILNGVEARLNELPIVKEYLELKEVVYRPSAPEDTAFIIKDMLGLSLKTVDEDALTAVDHPIADLTLEWRKANKIISTYIVPYRDDGNEKSKVYPDGLLHPTYPTTQVETSRTSANGPNVQNVTKRDPEKKKVRRIVKAKPGYKIVSVDYAGVQARNVAMESRDKTLTQHFIDWYDIHTDWVWRISDRCPMWLGGRRMLKQDKDVFKEARNRSKNGFVFPNFFGAQPKKISGEVGIDIDDGTWLWDSFWNEFPDIPEWHQRLKTHLYKHGYVTGHSGYRRHAPLSWNKMINAPIQADETIIVLSAAARLCEMQVPELQPILEVHDDLTFHISERNIDKRIDTIAREMVRVEYDWINPVPLVVEVSIGDNWCDMKEIAVFESRVGGGYREVKK